MRALRLPSLGRHTTAALIAALAAACGGGPSDPTPLPTISCLSGRTAYAKSVVSTSIPACSLARNSYNDPLQVLGPPDARILSFKLYEGFLSLGYVGHVVVDMEACAIDEPGPDVRVWQAISKEGVTLYAAELAEGPFFLVEQKAECGTRVTNAQGYCDFDLATSTLGKARFFKVEDNERFPCEDAGTDSEGADLDAVELLHRTP
jgi:hypothetical protein